MSKEFRVKTAVADTGSSVANIFDQSPVLSASGALLVSHRNAGTEYFRIDKTGQTIIGGTPGAYSPTGTIVVNGTYMQFGDGVGQIGMDIRSGASGSYISDGSTFYQYFLKSPARIEYQVKSVYSNNVGIIETSQANGAAGPGSPGFSITTVNSLSTSGDRLLSLFNTSSEKFYIEYDGTVYAGANNNPSIFKSREDDGATAVSFAFDTVNSLVNAGAKLLSIKNATVEKFSISTSGGINVRRSTTASNVNSAGEVIIGVTNTSSAWTVTLDTDDLVNGRIIIIKDESGGAGTNNITLATEGAAAIDGDTSDTTVKITANYGVIRLYSNGTDWFSW